MKLENQVVSLELAKKLKELGVKQESLFYWVKGEMQYGYEGEWHVKDGDNYFIFDEVVDVKFEDYNFIVDAGEVGKSDEDFEKYLQREKKLKNKIRKNIYSAFTVAELGEIITNSGRENMPHYVHGQKCWAYHAEPDNWIKSESEDDARAKMLIYLIENKLISL